MGLYFVAIGAIEEGLSAFERALAVNPRFLGALENRGGARSPAATASPGARFEESADMLRLHPGVRHHLQLFATARFDSLERALVMSSMPPQGRYEAAHILDRMWVLTALGRTHEAGLVVGDVTCSDPALRGRSPRPACSSRAPRPTPGSAGARPTPSTRSSPTSARTPRAGARGAATWRTAAAVDWTLTLSLDLPSFWANLAMHHEAAGEPHRTLPCLERAVAANPQHRRARKELALWLSSHGRAREAVVQFELLREIAPNYADVRFHLGILYMDRGDLDAAGDELTAALAANPRYTRAALNLARVRFEQHRWAEARAGYERVLADGLDSCEIRTALAEAHDRLGEAPEAGGRVQEGGRARRPTTPGSCAPARSGTSATARARKRRPTARASTRCCASTRSTKRPRLSPRSARRARCSARSIPIPDG
jgi:tetratricopeptide (TPR) repeat protein